MPRAMVSVLVLVLGSGVAWTQEPNPGAGKQEAKPADKKEQAKGMTLQEMLPRALKNHPDIRVAEAKLREAEAELDRAKLQVTQKVIQFHGAMEEQRRLVQEAETELANAARLVVRGFQSPADKAALEQKLAGRKARLAEMELELQFVLGRSQAASGTAGINFTASRLDMLNPIVQEFYAASYLADVTNTSFRHGITFLQEQAKDPVKEPMADRIRKALDTPVIVKYKDVSMAAVLEDLHKQVAGVPFVAMLGQSDPKVTLTLPEPVPLAAAIQALEDVLANEVRFGVRDYGLVVVSGNRPLPMSSPQGLWRSEDKATRPPADLDGEVQKVDPQSGLVSISIGSDAGLLIGHVLEVFRLQPKPKYLGTITLINVSPKEAVGKQNRNAPKESLQSGDKVTGRIIPR